MDNQLLINVGVIVAIAVALWLLRGQRTDPEFDRMYHEILNSDKYKVKGQYDRAD